MAARNQNQKDSAIIEPVKVETVREEPVPSSRKVDCIAVAPLLNIRDSANLAAPVIGTVAHGDTLEVEPSVNGWCKLTTGGYVKEEFLV